MCNLGVAARQIQLAAALINLGTEVRDDGHRLEVREEGISGPLLRRIYGTSFIWC